MRISFVVLATLATGILSPGTLAAIEREGRLIALDANAKWFPGSKPTFEFRQPEKLPPAGVVWGLQVSGSVDDSITPWLNGRRIDSMWVEGEDGLLLRLPPALVWEDSTNTIELRGGPEEGSIEVTVFSLLDGFEDIHFDMAFARRRGLGKAQPDPHPSQPRVDALHYDLAVELNHANTFIIGELGFRGAALEDGVDQFAFDFNANGGQMSVLSVDEGEGTSARPFVLSGGRLVVTLPRAFNTGEEFSLRVRYQGTPSTSGVFGAPYRRGTHGASNTPIIFTFSEPYGARNWWPCKDLPDDKATMTIRVTATKPYVVVSNGRLEERVDLGTKEEWRFNVDFPITTYLVSICSTNYLYTSTTYEGLDGTASMDVGHFLFPQNFAAEADGRFGTLDSLQFFAELFGEYPFLDHKYVTATHLSASGMEHTTCTSMPAGDVGVAPGSPLPGRGRRNVHEMAHHWFGNKVTCKSFDHLWLNEGFATWCEALYYEKESGLGAYLAYVQAWNTTGINNTTPLVHPSADGFAGSLAYRRGGYVLHMMRGVLGGAEGLAPMIAAIRHFLDSNGYGSVETDDFRRAMEESTGDEWAWFFDQWMYQPGRPTYDWWYTVREEEDGQWMDLRINQTQSAPMPTVYTMPIEIRIRNLAGDSITRRIWNDQRTQTIAIPLGDFDAWSVEFDPDRWILRNEATGNASVAPTITRVTNGEVNWTAPSSPESFDLIVSLDGTNWEVLARLPGTARSHSLAGLAPGATYWLQLRSTESGKRPSNPTNIYAVRRTPNAPTVLVVEGWERWPFMNRGPFHPFAATTAAALGAAGISVHTVSNSLIENGSVSLLDYDAVVWVLGEESTGQKTFRTSEQQAVRAYMEAGGRLLVSGAEIGWDLGRNHAATQSGDRDFYNQILKANYVRDDSGIYTVKGAPGSIFEGMVFSYDNGSAGIYFADYPDEISANDGGSLALLYTIDPNDPNEAPRGAATQFAGSFGAGTPEGRVVYMGFGFETIYPESMRYQVMARIVDFFGLEGGTMLPEYFLLH
jgi:hypothetical protein